MKNQMDFKRAMGLAAEAAKEAEMAGRLAIQTAHSAMELETRRITWGIHAYEFAAKQRHCAAVAAVYTLIGLLAKETND